ncbi:MAG: mechanosensitive ion channel [Planctomycetota bacterium]|nr:mechanosensitive ion channel [Planctomycetota bacterium]
MTEEVIAERIKQAGDIKDEDVKKKVLEHYGQAVKQLEAERASNTTLADFKQRVATVKETSASLEVEIDTTDTEVKAVAPANETSTELEQRRIQAEQDAKNARDDLAKWEVESKRRDERRANVAKELQMAKDDLANIEKALIAPAPPGEVAKLTLAVKTLNQTRKRAITAQSALLEQEIPTYDATAELLKLRIAALSKRAAQTDQLAKAWQLLVTKRREKEAEDRAEQARLDAASAHPALKDIAEENKGLADLSAGPEGLVAKIRKADDSLNTVKQRLEGLIKDQKGVEEKLKIDGMKAIIGPYLLEQRRNLPNIARRTRRIHERQIEIDRISWDRLDFRDLQKQYLDVVPLIKQIMAGLPADMRPRDRAVLEGKAEETLKRRSELLSGVIGDQDRYFNVLLALSGEERRLIEQTKKYAAILDEEILWLKSARALHATHWPDTTDAMQWLIAPENWVDVVETLYRSMTREWAASAFCLLVIMAQVLLRMPLRRKLTDYGKEVDKGYTQPFRLSLQAFALTFVIAALWPSIFCFLGWRLASQFDASEFARAVATGFLAVGTVLFILESFRQVCRPHGLGASHFRWSEPRLRLNRRNIRWFWIVGMPTAFVIALLEGQDNLERKDSLGRIALMFGLLLMTVFLARILKKSNREIAGVETSEKVAQKKLSSFRRVWYWSFVLGPSVLGGMSEVGYHYMAIQLSWRLLASSTLALLLVILHALGMRWLYSLRAKLALEQAAKKRAEAEALAAIAAVDSGVDSAHSVAVGTSPIPSVDKASLDLATVNSQTRQVLNGAILLAAIVGLWLIWAEVMPALRFLDVRLWATTQDVTKMVTGTDNVEVPKTLAETRLITLDDLLFAIGVFAFAVVLSRNIPGILEVAILQHLPIDSGGSYAISTLTRYGINVIGIIVAFNLMGIGWAQVQWLVAAMTFGLAFGMQEVFANFVSGLILFLERPIRIGDIVTIGDVTGTVSKIRIRATTVINWDRKEYVVPNKELITGRLLNWTLSDKINRIVVNLGVAYGSDTDRATHLLFEVLAANPHILKDPAPRVTFETFGESSLNFTIRAFLDNMDLRLDTIHWLHTEIHRRLKEAGIEIAFPQLDLHLRSSDVQLGVPGS